MPSSSIRVEQPSTATPASDYDVIMDLDQWAIHARGICWTPRRSRGTDRRRIDGTTSASSPRICSFVDVHHVEVVAPQGDLAVMHVEYATHPEVRAVASSRRVFESGLISGTGVS